MQEEANKSFMVERRAYTRIPARIPALYRMTGPSAYKFFESTVLNITPDGLCFISQHKLERGMKGQVQVELNKKDKVLLEIEVRWVKDIEDKSEYNVGVKVLSEVRV